MITKLGTDYFKGQKQDIYLIASTVTSDGELKSTQSGKTFGTCSCKARPRPLSACLAENGSSMP